MKQHFLDNYRALKLSTPTPHVFLKFEEKHLWKGFNDLHQLDLGNYVAELALVEQRPSLPIQVFAARGTLASLGGFARPTKAETFVLVDVPKLAWLEPVVDMLPTTSERKSEGVVVDLRKLRWGAQAYIYSCNRRRCTTVLSVAC